MEIPELRAIIEKYIATRNEQYRRLLTDIAVEAFIAGRLHESLRREKHRHVPHDPDTLQTVCEQCGAEIVPVTPDADEWKLLQEEK